MIAPTSQINFENRKKCHGFTVLSPNYYYPVEWQDWRTFFNHKNGTEINFMINVIEVNKINGTILGIHFWNKMSDKEPAFKSYRKTQFYTWLVSSQCPISFELATNIF